MDVSDVLITITAEIELIEASLALVSVATLLIVSKGQRIGRSDCERVWPLTS